jgi:two-component sensor histidine kinase
VDVSDEGPGPAGEPFGGLGLSLARTLAEGEGEGGRLVRAGGSRFTLVLPAA